MNSGVPHYRGAYNMALKARQIVRVWDMDWALEPTRAVGQVGDTSTPPSLGERELAHLAATYADDRTRLETHLGREFPQWVRPA